MARAEIENVMFHWNDFSDNMSTSLRDVYRDEDLFDITLMSDTDEIRAHKLILSACSLHFRKILQRLRQIPNPVIYLNGVSHSDLTAILEFMYNGEVSIPKDEVESFFNTARAFMVNGLMNAEQLTTSIPKATASPAPPSQKFKKERSDVPGGSNGNPPAKRMKTINLSSSVTLTPSGNNASSKNSGAVADNSNSGDGADHQGIEAEEEGGAGNGGYDYTDEDFNGDLTIENSMEDQENEEMTIEGEPYFGMGAEGDDASKFIEELKSIVIFCL